MGSLIRRSRKQQVDRPTSSGIADQNVDDGDWSAPARLFADLGVEPPADAGPEVTSAVDLDPRVRRSRETGQLYRKQLAWWAGRGGVVVVDQRQSLTARPDGRYEPSGSWVTLSSDFYNTSEPARRRTAQMPVNPDSPEPDLGDVAEDQPLTDSVLGLLPEPARRTFLNSLGDPLHSSATAIRATFPGERRGKDKTVFIVSALRLDTSTGCVIHAEHHSDTSTWNINHISYTFQPSTPLLPSRRDASRQRMIGG